MIVRNFQKGRVHNLYDKNKHNTLKGVLFFNGEENSDNSESDKTTIIDVQKKTNEDLAPVQHNYSEFSDSDPVREFIENRNMHATDSNTSLVHNFFAIAFRIDKLALLLFKFLLKVFDLVFYRVDRAIYWFDQVIVEQKSILSPKRVVNYVGRFLSKKHTFDSAIKKAKELNDNHEKKVRVKEQRSKRDTVSFLLPRVSHLLSFLTFPKFRLMLAAMFFLISLGSISLLMFPLVSAEMSSILQFGSNRPSPSPTPIRYNHYYQEEKDALYPIKDFRLSISKINLESNIVDNVDPKIEDEYKEKLQFGVAHAKGSYLPPENGPVYLFAHSTDTIFNIARFNAKFYSVRELVKGDEIKVFFNGKEYRYVVEESFVINPQEVDIIQEAKTDLILQTCWPPGTDWQRLIVLANRVTEDQTI